MWAYRARAHKPFLFFINRALVGDFSGPESIREMEVIKKRSFSSHLRERGRVACKAGLYIYIIIIESYKSKDSLSFNRLFFFVKATKDL